MTIGLASALVVIGVVLFQIGPGDADSVKQIQSSVLRIVGLGLAIAAAIELAFTSFTDGPDEALDPLMLALSAAIIFQLAKVDRFEWQMGLSVALYVGALAGVFAVKRFLARELEHGDWTPNWRALLRRTRRRPRSKAEETIADPRATHVGRSERA